MSTLGPVFNIGPTICGQILGDPYEQYRPSGSDNPLGVINLLAIISAWITPDKKGEATVPPAYAKPVWYGLFDPTVTQAGDYLAGPLGTFFIASQWVPQPIQLVRCNHTVTITEPAAITSFGAQPGYGGDQLLTETVIASCWPCSMLQGTKGEAGDSKLPGDAKMPWSDVRMPSIPGVMLRNNLIITDENSTRFILSSTEESELGWRMSAMRATT